MTQIIRLFAGKDVDMLTTLSTILTNAEDNQPALQKKRTNITPQYLKELEDKLDGVVKKYFGVDSAKQLRQQSQVVYNLEDAAYKAASEINDQVKASYSSDKVQQKEILRELGYADYFKAARKGDTEALINLLYQYQQNMTPELQAQLAATGIPEADLTLVTSYAQTLRDANVSQESYKSSKKVLTADAVTAFNDIYSDVVNKISKLARVFFPGNKQQQGLLSYTGLLKALNNKKKTEKATQPA